MYDDMTQDELDEAWKVLCTRVLGFAIAGAEITPELLAETIPGLPPEYDQDAISQMPIYVMDINKAVRKLSGPLQDKVITKLLEVVRKTNPLTMDNFMAELAKRGYYFNNGTYSRTDPNTPRPHGDATRGPARARRNSMTDERKQKLRQGIADAEGRLASMVQSAMQEGTKAAVLDFRIRDKALPGSARMRLETVKSYAVSDHSYHSEELRKLRDYIGKLKRDLNS